MTEHAQNPNIGKLIRFVLVGGASTALFAALTWLMVEALSLHPVVATVTAYAVLLVPNFIVHKQYTFASDGATRKEWRKFLIVHGLNISLSTLGMSVISQQQIDYRWGIAFSAAAVPAIVFVAMGFWVFKASSANQPPYS